MMKKLFYSFIFTYCFWITSTQAHNKADDKLAHYIKGSAAFSYRSDSSMPKEQAYLIPGALLGGEALTYEKGGSLDDAQLAAGYKFSDDYQISAVINAHEHDDGHELQLENLWLTTRYQRAPIQLWFDLGKLPSNITDSASWHASESRFTEASLLSDVFFGRHFNDTGIRTELRSNYGQFGIELWSGDNWPAEDDEGAVSVYMKTQPSWLGAGSEVGFWGMNTTANNRSDNRYNHDGGHSHGNDMTSTISEYKFTGDTDLIGAYITLALPLNPITLLAEAEWIQAKSNGTLSNANQTTDYKNDYTGSRFLVGLSYQKHRLLAQYEEITLSNHFFGDVTSRFITDANLMNNGLEPNKITYAWHWYFQKNLRFKLEYVDAEYQPNQEMNDHLVASVIWKQILL